MKVVVTGASSFLGKAVIKKLKTEGHSVTEFSHSYDEDEDRLPEEADIWIHFAWAGAGSAGRQDEKVQEYNVVMSMAALEKAMKLRCSKFMFAGSQAEYGRAQDGACKEEYGLAEPVSAYGRAKLLFSRLAQMRTEEYNRDENADIPMQYVHMRFFSVYGPGDHPTSLVNMVAESIIKGERLELGACEQMWNYLYIDDAAEAVLTLLDKGTAGIYNIAGNDTRPLKEYVLEAAETVAGCIRSLRKEAAAQADDKPNSLLIFNARGNNAEGSADLSPDISRLRALGFEERVSFKEGIKQIIAEKIKA